MQYAVASILHNRGVIVESAWPKPGVDAQRHSERLIEHLRQRIVEAGGWIGFADFMNEALYAPGLGYYSTGTEKLGEAGDFITAPEVSPLFGRCVASQCAEILEQSGGDTIVELGAGSGAMAAEINGEFPPARYRIAEVSADLRARQQSRLGSGALNVDLDWIDGPDDIEPFDGVILGNEVIDALPVERFRIKDGKVHSVGVEWTGTRFADGLRQAGEGLTDAVRGVERELQRELPDGYTSELRPQLPAFIAEWTAKLNSGAMIWIDYGCSCDEYYAPQRHGGTLMCHYRHRAHDDPFVYPGLQDITAWVDFTALAEAGTAAGLQLSGYTTQAHFLLGCGIDQRFDTLRRELTDPPQQIALTNQLKKLMMPGEMGERFRVMALSRNLATDLIGFSYRNLGVRPR